MHFTLPAAGALTADDAPSLPFGEMLLFPFLA